MTIALGTLADVPAGKLKMGADDVSAVMLGNQKVWPITPNPYGIEMWVEYCDTQTLAGQIGFIYIEGVAKRDFFISCDQAKAPSVTSPNGDFYSLEAIQKNPVAVTAGMDATAIAQAIQAAWNGQTVQVAGQAARNTQLQARPLPWLFATRPGMKPDDLPPTFTQATVGGLTLLSLADGTHADPSVYEGFKNWNLIDLFDRNPATGKLEPSHGWWDHFFHLVGWVQPPPAVDPLPVTMDIEPPSDSSPSGSHYPTKPLRIEVRDATGSPIPYAQIDVTIDKPGLQFNYPGPRPETDVRGILYLERSSFILDPTPRTYNVHFTVNDPRLGTTVVGGGYTLVKL